MVDEEIDPADSPVLTAQFFARAKPWSPVNGKSQIAVTIDAETLAWFAGQGEAAERHLTAALRIYAEAQKYVETPSH